MTFYNGTEGEEDKILRLSDAFEIDKTDMEPDIEVKVRMININQGKNTELMKACKPLEEYAWLIDQIRKNCAGGMEIEEAVDQAIDAMPVDYMTRMFLIGNRSEVKDMCITEYNEAETMKLFKEEGREEGRAEGRAEGRVEGENRLGKLISLLISKGRTADAQKAAVCNEARRALYEEFNII